MVKVGLELRIVFEDPEAAKATYAALKPDNVGFPKGLRMSTKQRGRVLTIGLESQAKMSTLVSTVDEVLEMIQVSQGVVSKVKG